MIRCEVIKDFTLERYDELEDIQRRKTDIKGKLFVGDTFKCDKKMADYLMGNNLKGDVVVKVIEIEPEKVEILCDNVNANQPIGELKPEVKKAIEYLEKKKTTKKKKSSKK